MHDLERSTTTALDSSRPAGAEPVRRRWVKLAVDESLFEHLHIAAAKSGMRITPYLRKHLEGALPFPREMPVRGNA